MIVYTSDSDGILTEDTNTNSVKLIEIEKTIVKTAAAIILVLMAIALIVVGFKLAFTVFWLEKFKTEKINEKAIAYYHYFGLMGRIFRFDIPVKASDIAEKAAFSNGEITKDEYKMLLTSCREHMKECAGGFPKIKQSVYRLFEIDIRDYK